MNHVSKLAGPLIAVVVIVASLSACDSAVSPSLEVSEESAQVTASKNSDLRDLFAGAAERGNDMAVALLSPSGEVMDEFVGSPPAVQAYMDSRGARTESTSAGKSMGGDVPWIQYVLREPSTIGFSSLGTSFTLGFPDHGPDVSPYPMYFNITSIFWDDDIAVDEPVLNYNETPGDSDSDTSTSSYPGPSGQSGHHTLWGVYYNGTGYDPCSPAWDSDVDYGIKASTTTGAETSANYDLRIQVGDCLDTPDIVHFSGYPSGSTSFAYNSGGDYWEATNSGYPAFQFTSQYDTDDNRYYDLNITSASCDEPQTSGFPSVSGYTVTFQVDMTGLSSGQYATCTATVEDGAAGGGVENFTYRLYQN